MIDSQYFIEAVTPETKTWRWLKWKKDNFRTFDKMRAIGLIMEILPELGWKVARADKIVMEGRMISPNMGETLFLHN